jgi:hypothetical protein
MTASEADAADFTAYLATNTRSITLKSIGLWTDAVVGGGYTSVTHFQIRTPFQGDEDGGTAHPTSAARVTSTGVQTVACGAQTIS